jgi:hypothetical protein
MPKRCEYPGCRLQGYGVPPLCDRHAEEVEEDDDEEKYSDLVEKVLENPQVQTLLDKASAVVDRLGLVVEQVAKQRAEQLFERVKQGAQARAQRATQPPPRKDIDLAKVARSILHFSPTESLTAEKIKDRRRELAKMCHPDKGGSTDQMQKINRAADILIKSVS